MDCIDIIEIVISLDCVINDLYDLVFPIQVYYSYDELNCIDLVIWSFFILVIEKWVHFDLWVYKWLFEDW